MVSKLPNRIQKYVACPLIVHPKYEYNRSQDNNRREIITIVIPKGVGYYKEIDTV